MFEKYDAYKDSGVEWIGDIPIHWDVKNLRYAFDFLNHRRIPLSALERGNKQGRYPYYGASGIIDYVDAYLFDEKLLLIAEDGANLLSKSTPLAFLAEGKYWVNNHAHILKPKTEAYGFWEKLLCSVDYTVFITGAAQPKLSRENLGGIRLPIPPINEQLKIAKFLEQKTSEIDQAIAIKEQQIALLNERKQIVIQKAVTQGLDPNVPMKDSGVEWIGQIPEHWEIIRSKFLFTQRKENSRKDDVQLSATQAYGVIPQEEYEKRTGKSVVKISLHLDKRKRVHLNDFVISMRSFQGGLERAWAEGCIRSSYVVLKPLKPIDPDYYGYLFKTPMYIKALQNTSNFIRDGQDLNFGNFSQVDLFIVPLSEQKQIVEYIKSQLGDFEKHLELLNQQIEKLKEYKTTLINDAVTGKIKVA